MWYDFYYIDQQVPKQTQLLGSCEPSLKINHKFISKFGPFEIFVSFLHFQKNLLFY